MLETWEAGGKFRSSADDQDAKAIDIALIGLVERGQCCSNRAEQRQIAALDLGGEPPDQHFPHFDELSP